MSQEIYLACHDCKEILHIGSTGLSGLQFWSGESECMGKLKKMVDKHVTDFHGHRLEFVMEQGHADENYKHIEWETN